MPIPPHPPNPKRWPKWLMIGTAAPALLLGAAWLGLSLAFPPERLAALLSKQVSDATGRDFGIQGKLSYRLLPQIAVVAEKLVLGNAPGGSRKDMLRIERAALELQLWPLLQGQVNIDSVSLDGADLLLETDRAGKGNWVMQGPGAAASPVTGGTGDAPRIAELASLHLTGVRVAYRDGRDAAAPQAIDLQRLDIQRDGDQARLAGRLTLKTQVWQLAGQTGRLTALLADAAWPFDLRLSSDGAKLAAKGQWLPASRSASADVSASVSRATALAPWLPNAARLPLPIELKTALKVTPQSFDATALQLALAEQQLTGRVAGKNGSPWRIDAQLASPSIDLARWLPRSNATGGAGNAPPAGRRWLFDDTPIDFNALPRATANVALNVQRLRLPGSALELAALSTKLALQDGRLKVDPLSFNVAGGSVSGHLALIAGTPAPPGLLLQLNAKDLSVDALAQAAGSGGYAQGGRAQLQASLSLSGASPRALAAGANGELLLQLAGTTVSGKLSPIGPNLLAKLLQATSNQADAAQPTTVTCAVVRLPLKAGVAAVDRSIAVETDQLSITASGEVNLRDETLRLAFRPHAKKALSFNTASLASLVLLKGPFLDPKFSLDAAGAAGLALSLGAAGATGGLSLLGERLFRQAADPQPCRYALTGAPAAGAAPGSPAPPADARPTPELKSLPGLFRNIFK